MDDASKINDTLEPMFGKDEEGEWMETNGEVLYWGVTILKDKGGQTDPETELEMVRERLDDGAEERYKDHIEPNMVEVKSGTFMMGSPEGEAERRDRETQHKVSLSKDFFVSKFQVTNALYEKFDPGHRNKRDEFSQDDNQPVINVNWYEAAMFCRYMGCRLPTEAEWEYAARGGKESKGYVYAGSNTLDEVGWYDEDLGNGSTHSVGQKKANELGLHDMSGNVREWCSDWYSSDYYQQCEKKGVVDDPQGPDSGVNRVFRGGYWAYTAGYCRSAYRGDDHPGDRGNDAGFRVVCVPQFPDGVRNMSK